MKPEILLGDEAVALGAIHAGLSAAYSYPGTPASEILEYLIRAAAGTRAFVASWSVNEKVAYEEALGVSFAGKRALVSMKHVGLNVAADPFMNSALTGANGGLVVVPADDPGMHSSQNEQDSRFYADFAKIPCFEPSNHQEAYEMTRRAFDVSEELGIPVMVRLVTRLSHSRSTVRPGEPRRQNPLRHGAGQDWTLLPVNARRRFRAVLDSQAAMVRLSEESEFNSLSLNAKDRSLGILASGIAFNYVQENLPSLKISPSLLKVCTYPVPEKLVRRLVDHVETVLVVEEGYPLIERSLRGLFGIAGKTVRGKLSGDLSLTGELSPETVRPALGLEPLPTLGLGGFELAARPPQLCVGCPHADTFLALKKALADHDKGNVFSDIGCYTLGAYPPYQAVQTCVCMGASIGMAKGGAEAGIHPSIAVIGDSTFGHSGLTPLLEAAASDTNMTLFILDNSTVAMTGGQPSFASGERLLRMIEGLGVAKEHIRKIEPLPKNLDKNVRIIREEISHRGLSVIVAVRECLEEAKKRRRSG
ncbi:MAG: indolepyruvate ferredoxin oxidoreductase [Candidatus Aminicenantes bacterium RBG_13_62_12]|nr:MAG: indolepyruvate ferredoxin oxidoreductase [Candidatus Aminicenantes bacterium RBG_13_62_12]